MSFPTSLDDLDADNPSAGDNLGTGPHRTLHGDERTAIDALESKVGIDSSAVTTSHDYKLSGVLTTDKAVSKAGTEILTNKQLTTPIIPSIYQDDGKTKLMTLPDTASDEIVTKTATQTLTKKTLSTDSVIDANVTVTEVLKKVYPVGSIYMNYLSTDPATLLGFGTWVAIAQAEALVGFKSADTPFGTVGSIGAAGVKTIALSVANLAIHTHTQNSHTHTVYGTVTKNGVTSDISQLSANSGAADATSAPTTAINQSTGSGTAHNNIQPSFVVYIWRRTA